VADDGDQQQSAAYEYPVLNVHWRPSRTSSASSSD
jgi:hypothetical protein